MTLPSGDSARLFSSAPSAFLYQSMAFAESSKMRCGVTVWKPSGIGLLAFVMACSFGATEATDCAAAEGSMQADRALGRVIISCSTARHLRHTSPSSRGLGRGPFKAKTRVRIPLGTNPSSLRSVVFVRQRSLGKRGATLRVPPAVPNPVHARILCASSLEPSVSPSHSRKRLMRAQRPFAQLVPPLHQCLPTAGRADGQLSSGPVPPRLGRHSVGPDH